MPNTRTNGSQRRSQTGSQRRSQSYQTQRNSATRTLSKCLDRTEGRRGGLSHAINTCLPKARERLSARRHSAAKRSSWIKHAMRYRKPNGAIDFSEAARNW